MRDIGCSCATGLAGLVAPHRRRKAARLPPQVFQLKPILGHRSANGSDLLATYDVSPSLLGEGTYGVVRRASLRKTGSSCVLKSISTQDFGAEERCSLVEEIAILESCDHPSIVRLFEYFEEPNDFHFTMEVCKGGELLQLLDSQGTVQEADARVVMEQALHALFYLHRVKHVAHRDIKPENLMLKFQDVPLAKNIVKVIDFGFAMHFEPGQKSFTIEVGTPEYMAPEMVPGPYNEKCDIWSCGVVLHELLSGSVPFQHDDLEGILAMAREKPLFLCSSEWSHVSEDAKDLVRSMCNRKLGRRMSAEQALRCAWFAQADQQSPRSTATSIDTTSTSGSQSSAETIGNNIREFSSLNDFQKVVRRLAAYRLEDLDVPEERNVFTMLDTNGDGRLSLGEFSSGCWEIGLSPAEVDALFHAIDVDESGCIEYTEWLSAAIGKERLPDDACWQAFRIWNNNTNSELLHGEALKSVRSSGELEGCGEGSLKLEFAEFVDVLRGLRSSCTLQRNARQAGA